MCQMRPWRMASTSNTKATKPKSSDNQKRSRKVEWEGEDEQEERKVEVKNQEGIDGMGKVVGERE